MTRVPAPSTAGEVAPSLENGAAGFRKTAPLDLGPGAKRIYAGQNVAFIVVYGKLAGTIHYRFAGQHERVSFFRLGDGGEPGATSRVAPLAAERRGAAAPRRAASARSGRRAT